MKSTFSKVLDLFYLVKLKREVKKIKGVKPTSSKNTLNMLR